jgi:two-component system nitrogen regulation sensor histidine kinase NtrY
MTFRARVLIAGVTLAFVPLVMLAVGVRRETRARLTAQYEQRARTLVSRARDALGRESDAIASRLGRLTAALQDDNRFRLAIQGDSGNRTYALDYAARAMRLAGLDVLTIHDDDGRILSSGHFRNDFDRMDPLTPAALAAAGAPALLQARTPDGVLIALARVDSARVAGRILTIVGGRAIDEAFITGLATDSAVGVRLEIPGVGTISAIGADSTGRLAVDALSLPIVDAEGRLAASQLVAAVSFAPLQALVRGLDRWFLAAIVVTALGALLLASWVSTRVSRPLTDLADKTARVDLERLDVDFGTDRRDEIGALSRLLEAMTQRLRTGAARLREAERRLAVGELARQVNHDVKNGLIPVRNVVRHLAEVAQGQPAQLVSVFAERQKTLESGLAYLESLAASYARLTPQFERSACDANSVVRDVMAGVAEREGLRLETSLADGLPQVRGDAVMLRRIIENLVENAVESLGDGPGTVRVATTSANGGSSGVVLTVSDTGPGMTRAQLDRAFEDFFTTKPGGTGLGLSIVRRLVLDLEGALRVDTAPGKGAAFRVEFPPSSPLSGFPERGTGGEA